jgi:hypothetical protein
VKRLRSSARETMARARVQRLPGKVGQGAILGRASLEKGAVLCEAQVGQAQSWEGLGFSRADRMKTVVLQRLWSATWAPEGRQRRERHP